MSSKTNKSAGCRTLAVGSAIIFSLAVTACGGSSGGGGGVNSTPPAAPTPPPPPRPPPPPPPPPPPTNVNYDTAEFRRSDGPGYHGAVSAYQEGATGEGIIVGVVDSGIDSDSHEFAGRIHAQSFDATGGGRGFEEAEADGHGTRVARVIAAAKDDADTHGIAFGATILALRADTGTSCTDMPTGDEEGGCTYSDRAIAAGIDRAVSVGARVINISLGGSGTASGQLRSAVRRATQAGIVIIVSAGNERNDDEPEYDVNNPSPFAQALASVGNGLVIISTSVDENDAISDFSNLAGNSRAITLSALGDAVCCVFENDEVKITERGGERFISLFAGTSFSAPQISGAAALLAQAFPNLTGAQIVNLLLDSARDVGDAGTDTTFGRGVLDIAAAFAPAGSTSLAGSNIQVSLGDAAGRMSGAMGDASGGAEAIILDSYGRAYEVDLAQDVLAGQRRLKLAPALTSQGRSVTANAGSTRLAFNIGAERGGKASFASLDLSRNDLRGARVLAGRVSANIAKDTRFSLGIRQSAANQVAVLQGQVGSGAFLTTTSSISEHGFERRPDTALAVRHNLGGWGITASAESGKAQLFDDRTIASLRSGYNRYGYSGAGLAIDREIGPLRLTVGANWLNEQDTILGARFSEILGRGGSESLFVDGSAYAQLDSGWSLGASWRQGWTWANASQTVQSGSRLTSNAFSFDVGKRGAFTGIDHLALRVSQPLRVTSGGISLELPVAYDYATQRTTFGSRTLGLAPEGREIASEMAWILPLPSGSFSTNFFWRQESGHFENAPDDLGVAFRLKLGF